jgi:hypothetical protein
MPSNIDVEHIALIRLERVVFGQLETNQSKKEDKSTGYF